MIIWAESIWGAQNSKLKNPGSGLLHKRKHNNGEAISGMKQDDLYSEFPSLFLEATNLSLFLEVFSVCLSHYSVPKHI